MTDKSPTGLPPTPPPWLSWGSCACWGSHRPRTERTGFPAWPREGQRKPEPKSRVGGALGAGVCGGLSPAWLLVGPVEVTPPSLCPQSPPYQVGMVTADRVGLCKEPSGPQWRCLSWGQEHGWCRNLPICCHGLVFSLCMSCQGLIAQGTVFPVPLWVWLTLCSFLPAELLESLLSSSPRLR